jgi:hypothetical protein
MAITPLFTTAELDTHIAAYKQAMLDVASGQSVRLTTAGGADRQLTLADLPEIRNTLEFFQAQKAKTAGVSGPQFLPGRPRR